MIVENPAGDSERRWAAQMLLSPPPIHPLNVSNGRNRAKSDPELAVLSAMAHGRDADISKAAHIAKAALAATSDLDDHRKQLCVDWVFASLSEAAGRSLQAMKPFKFEYQSDFARKYLAAGEAAGEAQGRAAVLLKQLQLKYGSLAEPVTNRVRSAGVDELDTWAERILSASSIDDVLR